MFHTVLFFYSGCRNGSAITHFKILINVIGDIYRPQKTNKTLAVSALFSSFKWIYFQSAIFHDSLFF